MNNTFKASEEFSSKAYIKDAEEYMTMYKRSVANPEEFWAEMAENLTWYKKWDTVYEGGFDRGDFSWFKGGKLNVSYNCIDRHLNTWRKNKAAIIWEGENGESRTYTYQQLHRQVCLFANLLKKYGIQKGDRVVFYMPMLPELAIGMLACTRIGAVHSVVFGGFSAQSLRERLNDCQAKLLVTVDGGFRAGKVIALKQSVDEALEGCLSVETCLVFKRTNSPVDMKAGRDVWGEDELKDKDLSLECEPEEMDAEDPLFILYTSGSTGKPKGLLHTTAGYLMFTAESFKYIFDYHDEDTYWCTADIGWITGHSYIVYGPLANGATTLMFEGVPTYPHPDRFWEIIEKYRVNIFYTAPTAIRALAREGEEWVKGRDLSSLRLLGTVGEPINPEAWLWYHRVIGGGKCPIVDTWWQTETGGILITPLPGAFELKPGSASKPFFGIEAAILDDQGKVVGVNANGKLVIEKPWPGLARTIYGDHDRFVEVYLSRYPGKYLTGDGARIDEDGDYWLLGRIDDVINVSGHRLGTAEVESALVSHSTVAEAAVVGFPHEIKGEGIYAFVTLNAGVEHSDGLKQELIKHVAKEIGPIAKPDRLQFADGLPKTRSGKIMRRILRKIAAGQAEDIGDTSTLADPGIVEKLVKEHRTV
ncbi:acetate--CoA ligase [bacterium]|nr:acetate--CoA ligase [bacterium]